MRITVTVSICTVALILSAAGSGRLCSQPAEKSVAGSTDSIAMLQKMLKDTSEACNKLRKRAEKLQNQIEGNKKELEECRGLSKRAADSAAELRKKQQELKDCQVILDKVETQNNARRDSITKNRQTLGFQAQELDKLNREREDCKSQLEAERKRTLKLTEETDELKKKLSILLEQQKQLLRDKVNELLKGALLSVDYVEARKAEITKEINSMKSLGDKNLVQELEGYEKKLSDFYTCCRAIKRSSEVLESDIKAEAIKNAISELESMPGYNPAVVPDPNPNLTAKRSKLLVLLKGYCSSYAEARDWSELINNIQTTGEKKKQIKNAMGKFGDYPYILGQFRNKETDIGYRMQFNSQCN